MRHGRNMLAVALMSNMISLVTGEAVQSSPIQPVEPGGTRAKPPQAPVRAHRSPDGLSPRQRRRLAKAARRAARDQDQGPTG